MPIRDDSAGSYGTWNNDDLSWLDYVKAKGSDIGGGAYNALANITGALSPIGTSPEGNMSLQVPPMITGIAGSYSRLSDPTGSGNAWRLSGIPELDAPIQQDMANVLLSLYGGNALNPLARRPVGSVGAGAKNSTFASNSARIYEPPGKPSRPFEADYPSGARPGLQTTPESRGYKGDHIRDLSQGQPAQAPRSLIENDPYLKVWADHLGLDYDGLLSPAIARSAADGLYDYFGVRTTDGPLKVGERAPNSYQWDMGVPTDEILSGSSAVGLRLTADGIKDARKHVGQYWGDDVSLLGSNKREYGQDAGEWVLSDATVLDAVNIPYSKKSRNPKTLFSDTGKPSIFGSAAATAGEQPRGIPDWLKF